MAVEREYIVTLRDPDDWDQFHEEMVKADNVPHIPDRPVDCSNERPFSDRQTHYLLTDDEAAALRIDPRVLLVELDPSEIPELSFRTTGSRYGTYDNSNLLAANMKNWGLLRSSSVSNPFSSTTTINGNYNFNLTGQGVDLVVIDTGIAEGHPELARNADGSGGSRVVDFDWTTLGVAGVTALAGGSGIKGFLGDCDGHGTNCATIAAGNTCGWAKDVRIYSIRAIPGGDTDTDIVTGNTLGLINISLVFDLVKAFHLSKPIGAAGYRRPTICTNSWTFTTAYSGMQQTQWRGTTYTTLSPNATYGQLGTYHESRYSTMDVAAAEAMAAGVIVIGAAGNSSHKADIVGGLDYNNYWRSSGGVWYYHRGGTPGSSTATLSGKAWSSICVGALDRSSVERKANFSNTGPRVDIYAPGYFIMGGAGPDYTSVLDPRDGGGTYRLGKLTGTSQATPQVAGMLACLAQARPWMGQDSARNWLLANSILNTLNENPAGGTGYTNQYYLQGGNNRIAHMPYNSATAMSISGALRGTMPGVIA